MAIGMTWYWLNQFECETKCDIIPGGALGGTLIGATVGIGVVRPMPVRDNLFLQSSVIFSLTLICTLLLILLVF